MIREYTDADLDALLAMHRAQGFDYPFPDLRDPIFVSKLVLCEDDAHAADPRAHPAENSHREGNCAANETRAAACAAAHPQKIVMAALARLTCEIYLLADPRSGTPRRRYARLLALHPAAAADLRAHSTTPTPGSRRASPNASAAASKISAGFATTAGRPTASPCAEPGRAAPRAGHFAVSAVAALRLAAAARNRCRTPVCADQLCRAYAILGSRENHMLVAYARNAIVGVWIVFLVVWLAAALTTKRRDKRAGSSLRLPLGLVVLALILAFNGRLAQTWLARQLLPNSSALALAGAALTLAGMALAFWARFHLGRNWGPAATMRVDHELVTSGPYAFLRHPIYVGMGVALAGTALAIGT